MVGRRRSGQVPASEWPKILERYLGGERTEVIANDIGYSDASVNRVVHRYLLRFVELTAGLGAPSGRPSPLDSALGARVAGAIIRFLETFEAARRGADTAAVDELCESSDRLMRAVASVRIALERPAHHGGW
jgi:hypothetical protein